MEERSEDFEEEVPTPELNYEVERLAKQANKDELYVEVAEELD